MRERLFRGKRKDNGKWVYGAYVAYNWCPTVEDGDTEITGVVEESNIIDYEDGCLWNLVIPETVGQYTGLRDCKRTEEYPEGQMIFEGDIVKTDKFNTPNKHYVIKYDLLLGAFIGEDDGTMYFTTFDGDSDQFEVIGNIHDNPELLKRNKCVID